MGARGHSMTIHADAKQGTLSAAPEGELIEVEDEPNGHGDKWLKVINKGSPIKGGSGSRHRESRDTTEMEY